MSVMGRADWRPQHIAAAAEASCGGLPSRRMRTGRRGTVLSEAFRSAGINSPCASHDCAPGPLVQFRNRFITEAGWRRTVGERAYRGLAFPRCRTARSPLSIPSRRCSVGGNRWAAAARHLVRLGHEVTVITTSAYGEPPPEGGVGVIRTGDLNTARPLRARLRRPPLPVTGQPLPSVEKPAPSLLTHLVVPDAYALSWVPAASWAARRLIRAQQIDCVITSSPFESTHLVPLALGRARPAWLADFRDGWSFEPLRPSFPTSVQRKLDLRLEEAWWRRGRHRRSHPADRSRPDSAPRRRRLPRTQRLGSGSRASRIGRLDRLGSQTGDPCAHRRNGRSRPAPPFDGLRRLADTEPKAAGRLDELVFAGRSASERDESVGRRARRGARAPRRDASSRGGSRAPAPRVGPAAGDITPVLGSDRQALRVPRVGPADRRLGRRKRRGKRRRRDAYRSGGAAGRSRADRRRAGTRGPW